MISSLPASISKLNTILESGENMWKFSTGPTLEIPGPTLFIVVRTPLKDVAKSKLSIEHDQHRCCQYKYICSKIYIYAPQSILSHFLSIEFYNSHRIWMQDLMYLLTD